MTSSHLKNKPAKGGGGGGECEQSSEWSETWTWGYVSAVLVQRSEVENPVR